MLLDGVEVVQQMWEDMPALGHDFRSFVQGFLPGLLPVGPGNVDLLTEAELAVSISSLIRHGQTHPLPGDVMVYSSAIQVPDVGGK